MDNRYVKCRCCSKRIYFGEKVRRYKGYCGVFCSPNCVAITFSTTSELNEEIADANCCTVYDDDKRKRELQEQMEKLLKQMENCKAEFESLNNTK